VVDDLVGESFHGRQPTGWTGPPHPEVAKGDPDCDQVLAALRQTIAALPDGAVVLAEDETTATCWRRLQVRWDRGWERLFGFLLLVCALACCDRR
jgi:hypothetical protein